jgi:ABC-type uncharacterized transport system ATPase subunit
VPFHDEVAAPSLTAAENLVISREDAPAIIDWRREREALTAFMDRMPFRVPLDIPVQRLAAGERQKLEILKQLYLGRRFLILDETDSGLDVDALRGEALRPPHPEHVAEALERVGAHEHARRARPRRPAAGRRTGRPPPC